MNEVMEFRYTMPSKAHKGEQCYTCGYCFSVREHCRLDLMNAKVFCTITCAAIFRERGED